MLFSLDACHLLPLKVQKYLNLPQSACKPCPLQPIFSLEGRAALARAVWQQAMMNIMLKMQKISPLICNIEYNSYICSKFPF